jgi:hypothetical protein
MKDEEKPYVFVNPDKGGSEQQEEVKPEFLDIVALIIAAFEIIAPVMVGFLGVVLLVYLLLKMLAR